MSNQTENQLRDTIEEMDGLSQEGFTQIAAMAKLALLSFEQPDMYKNRLALGDLATLLSIIRSTATDFQNCINVTAERMGCNSVDKAQQRRLAAQSLANAVKGGLE